MIDPFYTSGNFSFFQIEVISLWISKHIVLPPALISSAGIWSIPDDLWLFSLSIASSTSEALGSATIGSAVCISACPTSSTPCTLNSWEKYFLHLVGVCNQVALLILYYITSRLVPLLKVIEGNTYYELQQCVCFILTFLKIVLALSIYVYLF